MKHALDFWYLADTNDADDPVTVESDSDLERVLGEVLEHKQFHPTVVCVKDRPTLGGPLNLPDHQLKFDIDVPRRIAAIHTMGPPSFLPADHRVHVHSEGHGAAEGTPESMMRAWVTKSSYARATTGRVQAVEASASRSSVNTSLGFLQSWILRGRSLISAAMAAR